MIYKVYTYILVHPVTFALQLSLSGMVLLPHPPPQITITRHIPIRVGTSEIVYSNLSTHTALHIRRGAQGSARKGVLMFTAPIVSPCGTLCQGGFPCGGGSDTTSVQECRSLSVSSIVCPRADIPRTYTHVISTEVDKVYQVECVSK